MKTWLAVAVVIVAVWVCLHAPAIGHMGNSIVLDVPPARDRVLEPVPPDFRSQQPLPQNVINFRPDLLRHPVCVGLWLQPGADASGRLLIRLAAGATPLAEARLAATAAADGHNRVCLDLPLGGLQQAGTSLEIASDPSEPVSGLALARHQAPAGSQGAAEPAFRLEAHAPWRAKQVVSALVILALVLAVLGQSVTGLARDGRQVK